MEWGDASHPRKRRRESLENNLVEFFAADNAPFVFASSSTGEELKSSVVQFIQSTVNLEDLMQEDSNHGAIAAFE
jgi:hypothetical protein